MSDICSTTSIIPTWVTAGFLGATMIMLLFTSVISFKSVKAQRNKNKSPKPIAINERNLSYHTKTNEINENLEDIQQPHLELVVNDNNIGDVDKTDTHLDQTDNSRGCYKRCTNSFVVLWIRDIMTRRSVYVPLVLHLMDTATDFAAVAEFYQIGSSSTSADCNGLNVWYLFILSISAMTAYRIISSFTIWRITGSLKRVLMQFVDIELYQILWLSHRLGIKSKSSPQRLISVMEAVFEAAPQSMIQMMYLLKTDNLDGVIFISSILSFILLTMTIIGDDKEFIDAVFAFPWKDDIDGCEKFGKFVVLHIFRILDIPSAILLYTFSWYYMSGYSLSIIIGIDIIMAIICFATTKRTDALLSMIAVPFSFGDDHILDVLSYRCLLVTFWCYSVIRTVIINILIWFWIIKINEIDIFDEPFAASLWIFCSIASILKYVIFAVLYKFYEGDEWTLADKEQTDVNALLFSDHFDDAIEHIFYKEFDVIKNAKNFYGIGIEYKLSLLAISAGCKKNVDLFQRIFDSVGLDNFVDHEKYETALMIAATTRNKEHLEELMKCADFRYICIKKGNKWTALRFAIMHGTLGVDDEILPTFLKYAAIIIGNDSDSDDKRLTLLNEWCEEEYPTALHIACNWRKTTLPKFRSIYDFYPTQESKKEALAKKTEQLLDCCEQKKLSEVKEFILQEIKSMEIDIKLNSDEFGQKNT